ncbi:hypothetical protein BK816_03590 [Boudabousia tangfeifanii]|uniref:SLH domain-containing protein n=1 Tax=Boudabousia tangfeifanii TaxID=1912795 RepID=A0A1D9MJX8_9ACTO|nr:S-layer homology domain-containing protein [Boudabousia tangfeifanii]AOZ72489.1 hypothetical protein BK816_03590 [Boudabousia tangfeifanii]
MSKKSWQNLATALAAAALVGTSAGSALAAPVAPSPEPTPAPSVEPAAKTPETSVVKTPEAKATKPAATAEPHTTKTPEAKAPVAPAPKKENKPAPASKPKFVFKDVTAKTDHAKAIYWMANEGLTTGWADGTFRPRAKVTREAFAAFLYRFAGSPEFTAPKDLNRCFVDIAKSTFSKQICWMKAAGLANGWNDNTFRPKNHMARADMAVFITRLLNQDKMAEKKWGAAPSSFSDVPMSQPFRGSIEWLHANGISKGWPVKGHFEFRPTLGIQRDAVAVFLKGVHQKIQSENLKVLTNTPKTLPWSRSVKLVNQPFDVAAETNKLYDLAAKAGVKKAKGEKCVYNGSLYQSSNPAKNIWEDTNFRKMVLNTNGKPLKLVAKQNIVRYPTYLQYTYQVDLFKCQK